MRKRKSKIPAFEGNPKSPFSSRRLSDLIGDHSIEADLWIYLLDGYAIKTNVKQNRDVMTDNYVYELSGKEKRAQMGKAQDHLRDADSALILFSDKRWPKRVPLFHNVHENTTYTTHTYSCVLIRPDTGGTYEVQRVTAAHAIRDTYIIHLHNAARIDPRVCKGFTFPHSSQPWVISKRRYPYKHKKGKT